MRAIIQRVSEASVSVDNFIKDQIARGVVVLLGIEESDNQEDIDWLVRKIMNMRIFPDEEGIMNRSLMDTDGKILLISQFTLHASTKKGNRPSYSKAAKPNISLPLYEKFIEALEKEIGAEISTGAFGEDMKVSLVNDGPVTIIMDSKNRE
ncbi:MAG: D-aminoacyl-tRNA deacylase [Bacteroidota bacterium]